ncbi:MAG: ATP-binding protein, partial [Verrucomicrobiota bacterium]
MKIFPFSAIVGLELARKSLIYHAIAPQLGGVVLMGHRGCAKTTMIRGFGQILSQVNEQDGSNCVEVPLGCTEDRLLGGVHADLLIRKGEWTAQKGLLEQAHHGFLYID